MDDKRYNEVDRGLKALEKHELDLGWHFCIEWDGMLVGPGMPELECCNCIAKDETK